VRICSEIREELESPAMCPPLQPRRRAAPAAPRIRGRVYVSCAGRGGPALRRPVGRAEDHPARWPGRPEVPLVGFFAGGEIAAPPPVRLHRGAARQQQVVAALRGVLPAHALLHHREDTVPYECDGLTAYRALPLAVALPETEAQVAAVLKACHAWACRWWHAAPAPA
jgi:hypothetical protein